MSKPVCQNCGDPNCAGFNSDAYIADLMKQSSIGKDAALAMGRQLLALAKAHSIAVMELTKPLMASGNTKDLALVGAFVADHAAPLVSSFVASATGGVPTFEDAENPSRHDMAALQGLNLISNLIGDRSQVLLQKASSGDPSVDHHMMPLDGPIVAVPPTATSFRRTTLH